MVSGKAGVLVLGMGTQLNGDLKETGQNVSRIKFDLVLNNHLGKDELKSISEDDVLKYSKARKVV